MNKKSEFIILDRINPVYEAVNAFPRRIQKLFIQKGSSSRRIENIAKQARSAGIPVIFIPQEKLNRMSSRHQGLVAQAAPKEFTPLEEILEDSEKPFLLMLDEVEDPQNLGAVIRTAEGAGVDGLILPERRSAGLSSSVFSVSSGALEHLSVAQVKNLARTMDALKKKGIWIVGAEGGQTGAWFEFDYTSPVAIVLGSERKGLRRLIKDKCDCLLSLPLSGQVNSLNVASAAAVFMYEVVRQRHKKVKD